MTMLLALLCIAVICAVIAPFAWMKFKAQGGRPVVEKFDDNSESVDEYMARQVAKVPRGVPSTEKLLDSASAREQSQLLWQPKLSSKSVFTWPALDAFEFEVVGESHYQESIKRIVENHPVDGAAFKTVATLAPQDDNPYDSKAIAVFIAEIFVGYLSREDARSFRRRLAQKGFAGRVTECGAMITGGFVIKDGSVAMYGVRLDIKPF